MKVDAGAGGNKQQFSSRVWIQRVLKHRRAMPGVRCGAGHGSGRGGLSPTKISLPVYQRYLTTASKLGLHGARRRGGVTKLKKPNNRRPPRNLCPTRNKYRVNNNVVIKGRGRIPA